jgi:type IV pilus assembly protein PilP
MIACARYVAGLAVAVQVLLLCGCGSEDRDVKAELDGLGSKISSKIPALPGAAAYEPFQYQDAAMRDPFVPAWTGNGAGSGSGGLQPDLRRTKEQLEAYPLDSIKMVGTLARGGKTTALVRIGSTLYSVAVGNYMGTDYGRVTRITGEKVELREIVQDVNNIWVERITSIVLEENEGKK